VHRVQLSAPTSTLLQRLDLDLPDLASAPVWETFIDDPAAMAEAFLNPSGGQAPTAVPAEYVHAVTRAFQRTQAAIDREHSIIKNHVFFFIFFLGVRAQKLFTI
jgi:hypothetical protein